MIRPLARTILVIGLIATAWESACAQAPNKYALLIAVAKYDHAGMNKPEPLKYPEADAKAIGDFLKSGGYEVELVLGKEATREVLRKKLAALTQQADSDGVVLVGMFGHGVQTETRDEQQAVVQEGCFCPYDTSLRVVKDAQGRDLFDNDGQPLIEPDPASLIKLSELMTSLKLAKAGHRVVLADCCRTVPNQARGRSFGAGFRAQDLPDNTSVLFGCSPNERAFEHPDWGHGAFTKCLLDEMRELSLTGSTETAQLAVALKRKVPQLVASVAPRDTQTPKLFSTDSVDLQLVVGDPDYARGVALYWGFGMKIDETRAVPLLRKAADRGHPLAMLLIARLHYYGRHVPKDLSEANRWAKEALPRVEKLAQEGDADAQLALGGLYFFGIGVKQDYVVAYQWFLKGAQQGHPGAESNVGWVYQHGNGVVKDPAEAAKWYRKAADQNFSVAQNNLARLYAAGEGVEKDVAEAVRLIRKAADQGHSGALTALGHCYAGGNGVPRDLVAAAEWYKKGAEHLDAGAQLALGLAYWHGQGVEQDYAESARWMRKAADQEDSGAQLYLGQAYYNGKGVPRDSAEGFKWTRKSAEQGFAEAQHDLGYAYASGEGVAKDPAQAVKWYHKAAVQGLATSQYNLGHACLNGLGVEKNPGVAVQWFQKAADQNQVNAQLSLGYAYYTGGGIAKDTDAGIRWFRKGLANPTISEKQKQDVLKFFTENGVQP